MRALDKTTIAGKAIGLTETLWDPEDELAPTLVMVMPDEGIAIADLGFVWGSMSRARKRFFLTKVLFEHQPVAAALCMSAWCVKGEQRQPGVQVKDHQCREEFACIVAHEGDGQPFMVHAPIVRDAAGLGSLGDWQVVDGPAVTGPIAQALLDGVRR